MPAFAVITPTKGRPSLQHTVASVVTQLGKHDQYVIVGDGPQPPVVRGVWTIDPRITYLETPKQGSFGNVQRDTAISYLENQPVDFLVFVDDDDVLNPGVLDMTRRIVCEAPQKLHLFRCVFHGYESIPEGTILWRNKVIEDGNVGTGMIVCPNIPDLPKWIAVGQDRVNADFYFIFNVAEMTGVVWREEILQTTRPEKYA